MRIVKNRKSFEIGFFYDRIRSSEVKCLVVDGKPFTWGVLPDSLKKAKDAWNNDSSLKTPIMLDIYKHFIKSISKFIGKDLTIKEINQAIDNGFIDA